MSFRSLRATAARAFALESMHSLRGVALLSLGSAALLTGCVHTGSPPSNLDFSRTRTSENGLYRAAIKPEGDSIPQGKLQKWTLHLDAASGAPVGDARVSIDGGMPQHGHGLPTKPRVTRELGNGDYLVEGMKFNMGGWWVVKFRVDSQAGNDSLVFNLSL
ncbi:MAG: FixH family protein [Gemmatimonadota bacterium]